MSLDRGCISRGGLAVSTFPKGVWHKISKMGNTMVFDRGVRLVNGIAHFSLVSHALLTSSSCNKHSVLCR